MTQTSKDSSICNVHHVSTSINLFRSHWKKMQNLDPTGQGSGHQLTPGQLRLTGLFSEHFSSFFSWTRWLHRVKPCPAARCFHYQSAWLNPKWTTSAGLCHKHALAALWLFLLGHLLPSSSGKMMKTSLVTFTPTPKQSHSSLRLHNPRILQSAGSKCQPPDHQICDLHMSAENQTVKSVWHFTLNKWWKTKDQLHTVMLPE